VMLLVVNVDFSFFCFFLPLLVSLLLSYMLFVSVTLLASTSVYYLLSGRGVSVANGGATPPYITEEKYVD